MAKYDHQAIESKWRKIWEETDLYRTPTEGITKENKQYVLPQLPYPSGAGLHVGHAEIYCACDIYARYLRMQGKKVMEVIGWDSFGLPAENYAIKTNIHPRINTDTAILNFIEQIKTLGVSVDWSHTVGSHEPEYYKWTQWFFLLMYERGLAYRKKQAVNWCDTDKTVLANEQVIGGKCERCGSEVVQREMEQWFLKITDYADRLIDDLDKVDWPAETIKRQRDWIGRSEGALVKFKVADLTEVEVFTTRPDTIFGATFMVLAPEHKALDVLLPVVTNRAEVEKYIDEATHKSELQRQQEHDKTGVMLEGVTATNPANGAQIPVFIADYVLATYGTGSIMAVPGHDERDGDFARKFNLPIIRVVSQPKLLKSYLMGADDITDAELKAVGATITLRENDSRLLTLDPQKLDAYKELVRAKLTAGFWNEIVGENVWFLFKTKSGELKEFMLSSENETEINALAADFANDESFKTKTVWTWLGDNKFYADVVASTEDGIAVNSGEFDGLTTADAKKKITAWLESKGVAKLHKTYKLRDWSVSRQRFWGAPVPMVYDPEGNIHPVKLEDLPVFLPDDVDFKPTGESPLRYSPSFQGKVEEIYGAGWRREVDTLDTFMCSSWYYFRYLDPHNTEAFASPEVLKTWMPVDFYLGGTEHINGHLLYSRFFTKVLFDAGYIDFDEPFAFHRHQGTIFGPDGRKMSKRYGNVINPTDVVFLHGGDTIRIYEMFMGPLDQDKAWNPEAATGVRRFLQRVYDFNAKMLETKPQIEATGLDSTVRKVGDDIHNLKFNTAVSELMKALNAFEADPTKVSISDWQKYLVLLAPFAPFITEEMWSEWGNTESIHLQMWPKYDESRIKSTGIRIVVQINGKLRDTLMLSEERSEEEIVELAKSAENVAKHLEGKTIKSKIYVPGRLLNIVTD